MKQPEARREARRQAGRFILAGRQKFGYPFGPCISAVRLRRPLEGHRRTSETDAMACPECRIIDAELRRLEARLL